MKKKKKEILLSIADILDEHFLEIYKVSRKNGYLVGWAAQEIRKVVKGGKR